MREVLTCNLIKGAHNLKFEENWIQSKLGYGVKNWFWDSMIATHILDNRQAVCSLKFQVYVNFGVVDYDSEIEPWLHAGDKKDANAFNDIETLISTSEGKEKLLTYGGFVMESAIYKAAEQMGVDPYERT